MLRELRIRLQVAAAKCPLGGRRCFGSELNDCLMPKDASRHRRLIFRAGGVSQD